MNNSQIAKQLGSAGGKKSVIARFGNKTKEEVSSAMSRIRMTPLAKKCQLTPEQKKLVDEGVQGMVDNLNKNVSQE
jgi:hypothetical protein